MREPSGKYRVDQILGLVSDENGCETAKPNTGNRLDNGAFAKPAAAPQVNQLEQEIAEGLACDAFTLVYQDIYSVNDLRVVAREALIRWREPGSRRLQRIQSLINAAESSELIVPLGMWVLQTACQDAASWPDDCHLSVNVSPVQLAHGDFIRHVIHALGSTGFPPHRLAIEITETAALVITDSLLGQLKLLSNMGIGLCLDDFGTGYSSLKNLRLPFTCIKIDGSFVRDALHDDRCREIIQTIGELGRRLNVNVVAEGVETNEQLTLIREAGCSFAQGYLHAHPTFNADIKFNLEPSPQRLASSVALQPLEQAHQPANNKVNGDFLQTSIVLPNEFIHQLSVATGLQALLDVIAMWSPTVLSADHISICLKSDDTQLQLVTLDTGVASPTHTVLKVTDTMAGRVYDSMQGEICNALESMEEADCRLLASRGMSASLSASLSSGGHCYGTINFARYCGIFRRSDLERAQSLAHWLAAHVRVHLPCHTADRTPRHDWQLSNDGWNLHTPDGATVPLSDGERKVLMKMADASGGSDPTPYEALIHLLAANTFEFDPHRLEMLIHRLRKKVAQFTPYPLPLRAVRSKGYLFNIGRLGVTSSPEEQLRLPR